MPPANKVGPAPPIPDLVKHFACNFHLYMAGGKIPEDVEILYTIKITWVES